jgi:hypothetical protein
MNDKFAALEKVIRDYCNNQTMPQNKQSLAKSDILSNAVKYIEKLQDENATLSDEVLSLQNSIIQSYGISDRVKWNITLSLVGVRCFL